jgi:Sulfotransferase domain
VAKLIYIGGYGRSGSTLLEYLLSSHPAVVACGEVQRSFRRFEVKKERLCTCGRTLRTCHVWAPFKQRWSKLKEFPVDELTLVLLESVSADYQVMVDSSKTAWGSFSIPWRLCRRLGQNFLLVHLVRDPRGVCWSNLRTRSKKNARPLPHVLSAVRAALGWTIANLACEVFRWRFPERYLRVHYEDMSRAPKEVVSTILSRTRLSAPRALLAPGQTNRHQLHGNGMRYKALSVSDIKADEAWKTQMPRRYQVLVAALCWPLRRRYSRCAFGHS